MSKRGGHFFLAFLFSALSITTFFSSAIGAADNTHVKPNAPIAFMQDNALAKNVKNAVSQDKVLVRKLSERLVVDPQFNGDLPQAVIDQINQAITSKTYENSKSAIVISDAGYTIFYSESTSPGKNPDVVNVRKNWKPWFKATLKAGY